MSFFFCFFWIPEVARSARTEGLVVVGDSARGSEVTDLSRSRLGDAALRAARERWDWSVQILDTQISMYARLVVNLLLLFAMVAVLKNYQSPWGEIAIDKKKVYGRPNQPKVHLFRANMYTFMSSSARVSTLSRSLSIHANAHAGGFFLPHISFWLH